MTNSTKKMTSAIAPARRETGNDAGALADGRFVRSSRTPAPGPAAIASIWISGVAYAKTSAAAAAAISARGAEPPEHGNDRGRHHRHSRYLKSMQFAVYPADSRREEDHQNR